MLMKMLGALINETGASPRDADEETELMSQPSRSTRWPYKKEASLTKKKAPPKERLYLSYASDEDAFQLTCRRLQPRG